MQYKNNVEFKVWGKYALFTDPLTKIGGEKYSYQIPTYEAIKGILSSVYWKPTFIWVIDQIRVMHPIKTQTRSAKPVKFDSGGNDLSIYTYLSDVEYQVLAHFIWNEKRLDLIKDRNEDKHFQIAQRMIDRGGRRDIFLGTRECQGYVEPCNFGEGKGFYDTYPRELSYGLMFHGFDYPDEGPDGEFWARFWRPKMIKGIVEFPSPDDKDLVRKFIRKMTSKPPETTGLNETGLMEFFEEGGS